MLPLLTASRLETVRILRGICRLVNRLFLRWQCCQKRLGCGYLELVDRASRLVNDIF
jgi:hypothetical protein